MSKQVMPQQPLALKGNDISAYNVADDMPFGDGAGDAMLGFEEMFDDTNMFDWVRNFLFSLSLSLSVSSPPFATLLSAPIGRSNTKVLSFFSKNRVPSTSMSSPTPDPGDNSSPTPAYSLHYILLLSE